LHLVASARKRLHPQGAVAALIEELPHIQDARANASESCPLPSSSLKNGEASASQSCPPLSRCRCGLDWQHPRRGAQDARSESCPCHPPPSRKAKRQRANLALAKAQFLRISWQLDVDGCACGFILAAKGNKKLQ
jgi:hypothetical protein